MSTRWLLSGFFPRLHRANRLSPAIRYTLNFARMNTNFSGKWKLVDNENVVEFLTAMGMGNVKNKTVTAGEKTTIIDIEQTEDGKFTLKGGPQIDIFSIGEKYVDELPNGTRFEGEVRWEGKNLIIDATDQDGRRVITTRKIEGDDLILTRELVGQVTLKRVFRRQ